MDFKVKSKTWVGKMFQRLEAMCHEVDDFVCKDTVKYVENHVQTVGESVKTFCSGVVQDRLPPLVDPVKHAAQAVPLKQINSIGTYTRSIIDIKEKPVYINTNQSSEEEGPFDPTENCHTPSVAGLFHAKQFITPTSDYLAEEAKINLSSGQDGDALMNKNADMSVEFHVNSDTVQKNVMEERSPCEDLSSPKHKILSEEFLSSKSIDEKYNNVSQAKVSHATLSSDLGSTFSQEERKLGNSFSKNNALIYENADRGIEANVDSDMGVDKNVMEGVLSPSEDLISPELRNLFRASFCSESIDEKHNNGSLDKVSTATLVSGLGISSSQEEGTLHNGFLDEVECVSDTSSTLQFSKPDLSIAYRENKVEEISLISSKSFPQAGSFNLSNFSHANFPKEAETICCNPKDAMGCFSEFSGGLSSSDSFSRSILSLESDDSDTTRTDEAVSVAGSTQIKHEQYCKCSQFEALMSSSEIVAEDNYTIDVADPSMENMDLSDKVKLDESCVIVEGKPLFAFPIRARKSRSYKKIIQDVFASRKRLTKEYEQLAILYGDVDIESSQHPKQETLPSSGTISLELKKSPTQDVCDSEWELV